MIIIQRARTKTFWFDEGAKHWTSQGAFTQLAVEIVGDYPKHDASLSFGFFPTVLKSRFVYINILGFANNKFQLSNVIVDNTQWRSSVKNDIAVGELYADYGAKKLVAFVQWLDGPITIPQDIDLNLSGGAFEVLPNPTVMIGQMELGNSPIVNTKTVVQTKHKCNCEFRNLLMNGCKCGGI